MDRSSDTTDAFAEVWIMNYDTTFIMTENDSFNKKITLNYFEFLIRFVLDLNFIKQKFVGRASHLYGIPIGSGLT